ncbi:pRiA4b ORF-3-like protein [Candidatus Methanophagaceae archaeon]|nr:pRiA4b ORF-3-like protein [Methanophagales archaeon]
MGWTVCHLHEFALVNPETGLKQFIGTQNEDFGDEVPPESNKKIADYFSMENQSAVYTYDFGDNWEHKIQLEKIVPREKGVKYPICMKGKRACPPEDCGGIWGYAELLEIIRNPKHDEYEEMLEWLGGEFDPEYFDVEEVIFYDPDKYLKDALGVDSA